MAVHSYDFLYHTEGKTRGIFCKIQINTSTFLLHIQKQNFNLPMAGELGRNVAFQVLVSFEDMAVDFTWEDGQDLDDS
jgi:hypothetical protein